MLQTPQGQTPAQMPQPMHLSGSDTYSQLPSAFSIDVSAGGSITDAGKAENKIKEFIIYNKTGEDVTSHFKDIEEVSGSLVVDPAPLTVWTGSASRSASFAFW